MNKPKKAPENVKNASLHIQKSRKKKNEKRKTKEVKVGSIKSFRSSYLKWRAW